MKKPKVILSLTGGLGNQLFQLSAAMHLAESQNIEIEWVNSRPRLNNKKVPELYSFMISNDIQLRKLEPFKKLVSKTNGYILRMGVNPRWYEKPTFSRGFILSLAEFIDSIYLRHRISIVLNSGVGFSDIMLKSGTNLLVGYFQTYRWASDPKVFEGLMNLRLRNESEVIQKYRKLALVEKPLVVHVRRGDYVLEHSFGLLETTYYENAVTKALATGNFNAIWIFSDDLESAKQMFPDGFGLATRWIGGEELSSAETLEMMRFGHGYVIANSTFSWWGAFLSYSKFPLVVAPTPWFIGQMEPEFLIPSGWIRVRAHR
jgi:hypothetical protein